MLSSTFGLICRIGLTKNVQSKNILSLSLTSLKKQQRPFFQWLNVIFNQIDYTRKTNLGADRVCAEWLLRNGAAIKWTGSDKYLRDYNSLPRENIRFNIQNIDASESSISHYGFMHFDGCEHIEEIILHDCPYIQNEALELLYFVKNSLHSLRISSCSNITDKGILALQELSNLKTLELHNLQYVKNQDSYTQLRKALPNCKITVN